MKTNVYSLVALLIILSLALPVQSEILEPDPSMTIRQIAHSVDMKGRELAEHLGLPGNVDKDTALFELGISQQQLETALEGVIIPETVDKVEPADINTGLTLQDAAHAMGITGKELAHDLGLPVDSDKQVPLRELGVKETTLAEAVKHAAHEKEGELKWIKYPLWLLICGFAVLLLMKGRTSKTLYFSTLTLSLAVTGFALGKAPNPMESVVKLFKTAAGIYPDYLPMILGFIFFCILAIIGNKIICGWGCPFGALQELLYETPLGKSVARLRRKKLPFKLTNPIRTVIFIVFVLLIFGMLGSKKGFVVYHYINPFNLFDFEFALISVIVSITTIVLVSPFLYRSFCQFLCPFGLISWVLEKMSITKIKINHTNCTQCMACVEACPLEAMRGRMDDKTWPADCFSCARCLRSCDYDAVHYKAAWQKQ